MALHAHVTCQFQDLEVLHDALDDAVTVTFGREPAPETEVLIAWQPKQAHLESLTRLKSVIVPAAGIPDISWPGLHASPHLSVHNLHHNARATAELAVTLLLAAGKRVIPMDRALRRGDWTERYAPDVTWIVEDARVLVLGHGAIGRRVASMVRGLGAQPHVLARTGADGETFGYPVESIGTLDTVLPAADAVILCLPLTDATRGMFGARRLGLIPAHAVFVNVARAAIVDEDALYDTLAHGGLASAGLDAWYQYPATTAERPEAQPSRRPFHTLENVVLSPHRGGHSPDVSPLRLRAIARLLNVAAVGQPMPNRVDPLLQY